MILPLIGQECVITHKGLQVIGTVRGAGVIGNGTYRIHVKSMDMWIDAHYKADEVRLRAFVFDDGEVYDAKAAFKAKYGSEDVRAMLLAEDEGNRPEPCAVVKQPLPKQTAAPAAELQQAMVRPRRAPPAPPPARVVPAGPSEIPRLRRRV